MASRQRRTKSASDLKHELELARRKLATLEARAYEGELSEAIANSTIVSEFNQIHSRYKNIGAISILQAIGKAIKIPRLVVTQAEPKARGKRSSPDA